jgi:hypothetical protein
MSDPVVVVEPQPTPTVVVTPGGGIPEGGDIAQYLKKTGAADFAVSWATPDSDEISFTPEGTLSALNVGAAIREIETDYLAAIAALNAGQIAYTNAANVFTQNQKVQKTNPVVSVLHRGGVFNRDLTFAVDDYEATIDTTGNVLNLMRSKLRPPLYSTGSVSAQVSVNAGQTANALEVQDSAGTVRAMIDPFGRIAHGNPATLIGSARVSINTVAAASVGLAIKGVASQTGDLLGAFDSTGASVATIGSAGQIRSNTFTDIANTGTYLALSGNTATFVARTLASPTVVVRAANAQTADLLQTQDSAATIGVHISSAQQLLSELTPIVANNGSSLARTSIGAVGPSSESGISFANAEVRLYRSAAGVLSLLGSGGLSITDLTGHIANLSTDAANRLRVGQVYSSSVIEASGGMVANTGAVGNVGLQIKLFAGQTADALQVLDSASAVKSRLKNDGSLVLGSGTLPRLYNGASTGLFVDVGSSYLTTGKIANWSNAGSTIDMNSTTPAFLFSPNAITTVPVAIKMIAGQTADALQVQDSTAVVKALFDPVGRLAVDGATIDTGASVSATGPYRTSSQAILRDNQSNTIVSVSAVGVASNRALQIANGTYWSSWFALTGSGSVGIGADPAGAAVGRLYIPMVTASQVGITAKMAAGQTADALQVQDSTGAVMLNISSNGRIGGAANGAGIYLDSGSNVGMGGRVSAGSTSPQANQFYVKNNQAQTGALFINTQPGQVMVTVQGAAAQTGSLQEWQDSTGTALVKVLGSGGLSVGGPGTVPNAGSVSIQDALRIGATSSYLYIDASHVNTAAAASGLMIQDVATKKLGFFGAVPVVQQVLPAAGVVTADDIRTALINLGLAA